MARRRATSLTEMLGSRRSASPAALSFSLSIGGRPPVRPWGAGGGEPGPGPLLNDGPLELGERAEDVKDEIAAGSVAVDALGQRSEADLAVFEVFDGLDELLHQSR